MLRRRQPARPGVPWAKCLRLLFAVLGILVFRCPTAWASTPQRPNIVLVLADDLGATDLAIYSQFFYGSDLHETPHLDGLCRDATRFTHAYSPAPVCSPTRAAILTGKAPARLRMTIWSEGAVKGPVDRKLRQAESKHDLPHQETTLAEQLQAAGYLTAAVGKWHLGDANHAPETQGFDINIGGTHWGAPQTFFWPYRGSGRFGEFRYVPHLEFGRNEEYLTDRLTDEALRVIDHAASTQQPFFLYLAHHAPHTPIEAKASDVQYFEARLREDYRHQNPTYAAMIKSLDESVGRLLNRLDERGLSDNTWVIFTSDNGGYIGTSMHGGRAIPVTSNWPLRSGKGTLYEGGIRVPLIIRCPEFAATDKICHQPVVLTDLYHTLVAATGVAAKAEVVPDGLDLTPLLRAPQSQLARDTFYFHYPHYYHAPPSTPASAIRHGAWKLIEYFENRKVELFNLQSDPGEQQDLASQQSEVAKDLLKKLEAWRSETGAALPTLNVKS